MDGQNQMPGMSPTETQMNNNNNSSGSQAMMMMMMGHMTFFWSKNAEILFSGWPGTRTGMYVLALIFVFVLAVILEWLSQYCNKKIQYKNEKDGHHGSLSSDVMIPVTVLLYGVKIGVAYLVMLAVMSFNVGVLIVAIAGHTVGFLFFGCKKTLSSADLSPGHC